MSMTWITALQMIEVLILYILSIFGLPMIMWRRRLSKLSLTDGFMMCCIAGNFWIINAVLFLEVFKICNWFTLFFFTYGVAILSVYIRNDKKINEFVHQQAQAFLWLLRGELKGGLYYKHLFLEFFSAARKESKRRIERFNSHWSELLLLIFCSGYNLWFYSYQTFHDYGYGTSDLPVHTSWINAMLSNHIFSEGIYPFGFHAVLFFIRKIFGINTFFLIRVFGPIQTIFIMLMIYVLLKKMCKTKYGPIFGLIVITFTSFFTNNTIMRYQWPLPEEYGMMFIYPMIIYLAQYILIFDKQKAEIPEISEKKKKPLFKRFKWIKLSSIRDNLKNGRHLFSYKKIRFYLDQFFNTLETPKSDSFFVLVMLAMCVYLVTAIHFYDMMIAAFLCGIVLFFFLPKIIGKRSGLFWKNVFFSVAAALFLAGAPMGISLLNGNHWQGSIYWGLGIIEGKGKSSSPTHTDSSSATSSYKDYKTFSSYVDAYLSNAVVKWNIVFYGLYGFVLIIALILFLVPSQRFRGRYWLSILTYIAFITFISRADYFHLPVLMDDKRITIYLSYAITLLFAFPFDLIFSFLERIFNRQKISDILEFVSCLVAIFFVFFGKYQRNVVDFSKKTSTFYYQQFNSNVMVLYDLIDNYPKYQWTIISSVTEGNQVFGLGRHFELSDLTYELDHPEKYSQIYFPTKDVFVMIEKKTLPYAELVDIEGEKKYVPISEDYATQTLEKGKSSFYYYQKKRPVVMSKAYYWMQAFRTLYPDCVQVYYEDDYTAIYRIVQNTDHLLNFAVNYKLSLSKTAESAAQ